MRQRILAVLLAAFMVTSGGLVGVAGATQTGSTNAASQQADETAVNFSGTTSGGQTVVVDEVTLEEGGFVTIHDSSLGDGAVLGSVRGSSAYLEAGTYTNVTVHLDEPLSEDDTLFAMAHRDTDADRAYSFVSSNGETDGPYTSDGDIVMDSAEVTVSASVSMSDQPTDGDSVLVDRVELSEGGFVTMHDSTLLDGEVTGSVVGSSEYLEAGVHENVRVELDDSVTENDTLIPMPHRDTNDNEVYDFVEEDGAADGPFRTDEGGAVIDTAAVTVGTGASTTVADQNSGGYSVVVKETYLPEGGFVTMHDSTLADGAVFESIRGTSDYLEPGYHRNVVVHLDDELTADDSLFGMAHQDTNGNEAYDFPGSEGAEDGPYTVDGDIAMDDGEVTVSGAVDINAQSSDGRTVVIDTVELSEGGFVTVHDSTLLDGAVFDSVLGTSEYLEAGHHHDVEVTLDSPVSETQTLFGMAHEDTNDNETYDFVDSEGDADGPVTANGDIVMESAQVSVPASVSIADQSSEGETVVVEEVTLRDGGFVTIHDGSLLDGAVFDSVRGSSDYLEPGTHMDVEITLDTDYMDDGTVIAMPHTDSNSNEAYDFVETDGADDGPYVAAGGPVVHAAALTVDGGDSMDDENGSDAQTTEETMSDGGNDEMNAGEDGTDDAESDGQPGFGVGLAVLAVLGSVLLLRRRI